MLLRISLSLKDPVVDALLESPAVDRLHRDARASDPGRGAEHLGVARWGKPKGSVGRSAAQRPVCGLARLPPSRLPGPVALACWAAGVARSVAGTTGRLLDFAQAFTSPRPV